MYILEPSVILGSESSIRFFISRFSAKYLGTKEREFPRFLLAMMLYALPAAMLYSLAFYISSGVHTRFLELSRLSASLLVYLLLISGYALVVYAFDAFLFGPLASAEYVSELSLAEFALWKLRSGHASLFARSITVLSTIANTA